MTERFIVTAELIKKTTEDGLIEIADNIEIGKIYQVDINSIQMVEGINIVHNTRWEREMIFAVNDEAGWMPTELLKILKQ